MPPIRRRHRSTQRRELGRRLELGLRIVLVALVGVAAAMLAWSFRASEATIGFDETNGASGTLASVVTVDRKTQMTASATCRPRETGPSDCRLSLKLPSGEHFIQVRVKHPDGRWTPDSTPTVIEVP
jgi:hypothetical protein